MTNPPQADQTGLDPWLLEFGISLEFGAWNLSFLNISILGICLGIIFRSIPEIFAGVFNIPIGPGVS
jgi:hypothetical protein